MFTIHKSDQLRRSLTVSDCQRVWPLLGQIVYVTVCPVSWPCSSIKVLQVAGCWLPAREWCSNVSSHSLDVDTVRVVSLP